MKTLLLSFIFIIFALPSFAQVRVSGVVADNKGELLMGVTVIEQGTNNGTITDSEGKFSFNVSSINASISATLMGYETEKLSLNGRSNIAITLKENTKLLDAVEIVGSRSLKRTSTSTLAPVDVLNLQEISSRNGQLDINQLLQYAAPSFNSNRQTGSDGADHVDPASLRGLGPDQTLVLINGKRMHQSSLVNLYGSRGRGNTGTDLNTLPIAAIERIEILRDGAAAQYGSDAIAGVINIVLKQNNNGISLNANAGTYQAKYRFDNVKWDGLNYNFSANFGLPIKENGFVNVTLDNNYRDFTNRANTHGDSILARRQFGDPRMQNTTLFANSLLPVSLHTNLYVLGGCNWRTGDAFAWTRFADDDRNVQSIYPNGFDPIISSDIFDVHATVGIKSTLNKGWNLDISNTYGKNDFHYYVNNTLNRSLFELSPLTFDAGGYNLNQNTMNLGLSKFYSDVLQGLNFAFGAEYRRERYTIFRGEEASWKAYIDTLPPGSQGFPGFQPNDETDKSRTNVAGYADIEADINKSWTLAAALRAENYSDFGKTINWKLSTRYELMPWLALRGTGSTGFRAPSLPQKYFNSTITNFIAGEPVEVLIARNEGKVAQALGIPKLKQETSKNFSLGFAATPGNNFSLTVDVYQIQVKDRIVLTGQFSNDDPDIGYLLDSLNVGKAQLFTNAVNTTTRGADIIGVFSRNIFNQRFNFMAAVNLNKLTIDKIFTNDKLQGKEDIYFDLRERYFLMASAPPSKISAGVEHNYKMLTTNLRFNHFGKVTLADWNYDESNLNHYDARLTTDLSFTLQLNSIFRLTLGGSNIFNVYPTMFRGDLTESGGAWDPVQMGNNGAFWFLKANAKL